MWTTTISLLAICGRDGRISHTPTRLAQNHSVAIEAITVRSATEGRFTP